MNKKNKLTPEETSHNGIRLFVERDNLPVKKQKRCLIDASVDSIVDPPFTETYQSDFKENRREYNKLITDD